MRGGEMVFKENWEKGKVLRMKKKLYGDQEYPMIAHVQLRPDLTLEDMGKK